MHDWQGAHVVGGPCSTECYKCTLWKYDNICDMKWSDRFWSVHAKQDDYQGAAQPIAAGCLCAGVVEDTSCHGNSSVSPTQLNGGASGDCWSIIRDDALIGSLTVLSDEASETCPWPRYPSAPTSSLSLAMFSLFSWMWATRHRNLSNTQIWLQWNWRLHWLERTFHSFRQSHPVTLHVWICE